jgi:hypothetical protein
MVFINDFSCQCIQGLFTSQMDRNFIIFFKTSLTKCELLHEVYMLVFIYLQIDRLKLLNREAEEKAEGSELQINRISTEYRTLLEEKEVSLMLKTQNLPHLLLLMVI